MSNSAQNLQLCPPYIVLEDCKVLQPNSTSSWRYEMAKFGMCTVENRRILENRSPKKFKAQYLLNHTEFREECQRQFCRAHSGLSESYMVHIFWSWSWSWKKVLKLKFGGAGQGRAMVTSTSILSFNFNSNHWHGMIWFCCSWCVLKKCLLQVSLNSAWFWRYGIKKHFLALCMVI